MSIGEKIYKLRVKANISQETMALDLGVSRQAVSKWETNQSTPDLVNLKMIANYFNVPLSDLIDDNIDNVMVRQKELSIITKLEKGHNVLLIIASIMSGILYSIFLLIVILQKPLVQLFKIGNIKEHIFIFPIFDFIALTVLVSFIIIISLKILLKKNENASKISFEIVCISLIAILTNFYLAFPDVFYRVFHMFFDNAYYALSYSTIKSLTSFIKSYIIISCIIFTTGISIALVTKILKNK